MKNSENFTKKLQLKCGVRRILTFAILLTTSTLYAQLSIMPKAGVSVASVSLSDDLKFTEGDYKPKIGFIVGAAFDYQINEMFSVQPELLFHQKGSKYKYDLSGEKYEESITTNYIELPVLVKV